MGWASLLIPFQSSGPRVRARANTGAALSVCETCLRKLQLLSKPDLSRSVAPGVLARQGRSERLQRAPGASAPPGFSGGL